MTIGLDSQILIYAGVVPNKPQKVTDHLKELRRRAKLLLSLIQDEIVVLPTVAIAEILVPVPASRRGLLLRTLTDQFDCRPLDLQAASIASELWAEYESVPADLQYDSRHVMRADTLIVATAKAAGANVFYSHDRKCRAMAKIAGMQAKDMPPRDPKGNLFEQQEAEEDDET
jgi:predicted nucleic acid-binding protein